jgi:cobalt-zinc-cadmium efflux system outer membrane protein
LRFAVLAIAVTLAIALLPPHLLAQTPAAQTTGPVRVTLDEAIQLALEHNHNLKAARTTIQQSEGQEITAYLRPNPVLGGDYDFVPVFSPSYFGAPVSTVPLPQEADATVAYTVELWGKRRARLFAAKDQTSVTRSLVADNERTLVFNVASQFVGVQLAESTLDLAQKNLKSYQSTVDISEHRYKIGDISQGDFLKIKIQLLQFQTDVANAQLAKAQALVGLRQLLGYESVPADFDVTGDFEYKPITMKFEDLQAKALAERPDLRAARQGVTAAQSQYRLAKANGKPDLTPSLGWSHAGNENTLNFGVSVVLPVFNRNQGEIARTSFAITQAQELAAAANDQVMSDVKDAYEGVRANDQVVTLYLGGYLDEARLSRDISEYAYKRGAASLLDFLDAERSYRATELAYRQSLASYLMAVEQLREAVGVRTLP